MIEIQYEVREQDLLAFNDHLMKSMEPLQKTMRRHQSVIPGVIVVIALLLFFIYKDTLATMTAAVIATVWGLGVPAYLKWNWRSQIKRMYSEEEKSKVLGSYTLRVEKSALVEIGGEGESRLNWSDLLRVEVSKQYAFIYISLDTALIIPRATIKKGDLYEFVKKVDENIDKAA